MRIRVASLGDVDGIAQVHVDSWRTTYKGIISDTYLSSLTLEGRKKNWIWTFNHLNPDEQLFVAEDNGNIVGFANGGKNRIDGTEYAGELYAIYLLEQYQGKGIGKKLVQRVMRALMDRNYYSMLVWVLESNPAIEFYRKLGGKDVMRKEIQIGEETLMEVALGWKELRELDHPIGGSS